MPCLMDGLATARPRSKLGIAAIFANATTPELSVVDVMRVHRLGRHVVVDQLERQFDHSQPEGAVVLRPIVAGRGQMLKQGVDDRV